MQVDNELDISVEFCQPNYNLGIHRYGLMSLQSPSIIAYKAGFFILKERFVSFIVNNIEIIHESTKLSCE